MTDIAIVVGHNARAQGAVRVTDGRTEFDWNGELAALVAAHDPAKIKVFRRVRGGGYSAEIERVYGDVDASGAKCALEFHFNASNDPGVGGCETLTSGTAGSKALAKLVQSHVLPVLGNADRGLVTRRRYERGGRSLWQGKAPCVLTEPYFGSNAHECLVAQAKMEELAEALYRAARAFVE